jgi:hypothetical protein
MAISSYYSYDTVKTFYQGLFHTVSVHTTYELRSNVLLWVFAGRIIYIIQVNEAHMRFVQSN